MIAFGYVVDTIGNKYPVYINDALRDNMNSTEWVNRHGDASSLGVAIAGISEALFDYEKKWANLTVPYKTGANFFINAPFSNVREIYVTSSVTIADNIVFNGLYSTYNSYIGTNYSGSAFTNRLYPFGCVSFVPGNYTNSFSFRVLRSNDIINNVIVEDLTNDEYIVINITYNYNTHQWSVNRESDRLLSSPHCYNVHVVIEDMSEDPYSPGGNTEPGGGEGGHDDTEDDVDFPSSPTLNALSAKFISLYTPTMQQLDDLASFMWSGPFDPDTFKKIFGNPMQAILGLSIVPVTVPTPVGPPPALTLGNVNTGVGVNQASEQYIEVDCGSLSIEEYWGSYLDYEPYTRTEIYLPYIGVRNISTDDIMGKTVAVKYKIDILSGACIALIKCDSTILYSFNGVCAVSIPITGNDWTNVINGSISAAISSVGLIAGTVSGAAPLTAASAVTAISSASQNVMQMKPYIDKSGSIGGNAGMLGVQYPYMIITRPRQALPENQNHYTGYPSFITSVLGDLSGMTYVDHVHLENIPCTSAEQSEIESLLKGGVIF